MTTEIEKISELKRGDIVRHKASNDSFVVVENYGHFVIAVNSVHISQPSEWFKIEK